MRRPTIDMEAFAVWLTGRPAVIQALARSHPPDRIYRNTETGQMMILQAYGEDGTLRAFVIPECSGPMTAGCSVFGLHPTDLVEASEAEYAARKREFAWMHESEPQ